jgi:hypothetical protein
MLISEQLCFIAITSMLLQSLFSFLFSKFTFRAYRKYLVFFFFALQMSIMINCQQLEIKNQASIDTHQAEIESFYASDDYDDEFYWNEEEEA